MSYDRYRPDINPTYYESLRESLLADVEMGGYGGKPHGGNLGVLLAHAPLMAIEVLEKLLDEMQIPQEEWPRTIAEIAALLHFETDEDKDFFIRVNTPKSEGGSKIRHAGEPLSSASDLAEFLADVGLLSGPEKPIGPRVDPRLPRFLGSVAVQVD